MKQIVCMVSYAGTHYEGFQRQPERATIQGELEAAIYQLTGERVNVHASGRTDSGVHAYGQVFSFQSNAAIPPHKWSTALRSQLPADIVVLQSVEAPLSFHPRKSTTGKTYRYSIWNSRVEHTFMQPYVYRHPVRLDADQMNKALAQLIGQHNFTSFCSVRTAAEKSRIRTITRAEFVEEPQLYPLGTGRMLHMYMSGTGFLYNMVRIIAGTVIQIGEGKRKPEQMAEILAAQDRGAAGPTAKAEGLTLLAVHYGDQDPFDTPK